MGTELSILASQAEADASALLRYAGDVETIQHTQNTIASHLEDLTDRRRMLRRQSADASVILDDRAQRSLDYQLSSVTHQMTGLNAQMAALVQQRAAADATAIMSLTGIESRGTFSSAGGALGGDSSRLTLRQLEGLSEIDLATLLTLHPELIDTLQQTTNPRDVSAWWAQLTLDQKQTLAVGAAGLIGALGGIPTQARLAANRVNAAIEYQATQRQIAQERWFASPRDMADLSVGGGFETQSLAQLQQKSAYLEKVMTGTVQLYLYQPGRDRIVEMIGSPNASTTHAITYVPGTFSNQYSFYTGDVQQVGTWLNGQDPNMVVFVWHGGEFPGQTPGIAQVDGILAANENPLAISTGRELANFQQEIATDANLAAAQHDAVAHSWGLAATTASEMANAHYDKVVSLSGAWMPADWKAQGGTSYSHYTYADFLTVAKEFNFVGGGNVPDTSAAFAKPLGDPIPAQGDWTLTLPTSNDPYRISEPVQIPMNTDLARTHSLVASINGANQSVLDSILERLHK